MKPRRVLVTAYSCEPGQGSEPGVGWNWVRQIAQRFETTLITRENNVEAIQRAAREEGLDLEVYGYDLPAWARFWKRGARGAIPYYYLWQLGLVRLARRLDRAQPFDLCHHLTFVSSVLPSGLSFLGRPFVWGPVGRHPEVPRAFLHSRTPVAPLLEWFKERGKRTLRAIDPLLARTVRKADLILSLSSESERDLPKQHESRTRTEPAIGVDTSRFTGPAPRSGRFEIVFSGRLVDLKGARIALEACTRLAKQSCSEVHLRFVGDGPLRSLLAARAKELGVESQVEFTGYVTPDQALEAMNQAHVLLFPSFEGAGMVVLEAMAAGAVVCCLNRGGPAFMVGADRGIAVPCSSLDFEATVHELSLALSRLEADEAHRLLLAHRAFSWVSAEQDWNRKGDRLGALYQLAQETNTRRSAG
ncbi:MAG: glycosyltransferase family 4 protein [Planctomycetota bacterium]